MECDTEAYNRYLWLAIPMGVLYSLGVPILFYSLVHHFADYGKRGDHVVQGAIGWMCTSFLQECV